MLLIKMSKFRSDVYHNVACNTNINWKARTSQCSNYILGHRKQHFSYLSWSEDLNNSFWCMFLSLYPSESEQHEQQPPQHLFAFTT